MFKAEILTTICSIVGIITALLLAKGKNLGQIFGLLIVALYSIVSFKNKNEAIKYLVNETGLSKQECSEAYNFIMNLDLEKI